jgi:predicted acyltransferase (DUF342 family)
MNHHSAVKCTVMLRRRRRATLLGVLLAPSLCLAREAAAAPSCPIEVQAIESAKPNKVYLFFPAAQDNGFPESMCTVGTATCFAGAPANVTPVPAFDITQFSDYTGTAADLESAISDVVTDDYCEFNVQVFTTTTVAPATFPNRVTVAVGSDSNAATGLYGIAQEVDTADAIPADYARTWGGTYQGLDGTGGDGLLAGANSTVQRWAFALGGTAAHEAGHTYGLQHSDGAVVKPGEPDVTTHIMPAGGLVPHSARCGFRRHFGDTEYGILAANVGLSVESLHNWDYTNPNGVAAASLQVEVLSTSPQLTISWFYNGNLSPWTNPTVSAPTGTRVFKGTNYNVYDLTFSTGQAWANGSSGQVPPGVMFHVGAAFSEADFSVPNSVIVSSVTLLDSTSTPLTLHPRMVGYDAGNLDAATGALNLGFFGVDDVGAPLVISNILIQELPRVLSLQNMVSNGPLLTFDGVPVLPWSTKTGSLGSPVGADTQLLNVANMSQGRHIFAQSNGQCTGGGEGSSGVIRDSTFDPDPINDCANAGTSLDLFPSTTMLISATVTDPNATHWDPAQQKLVVGPLDSRVFFQVAGRHPDLNRNGVDDTIDIVNGTSVDTNPHDGVPDEVQACLTQLNTLNACELQEQNLTVSLHDIVRQQTQITQCSAAGGDFACCPVPVRACALGTRSLDLRDRASVSGNVGSNNLTVGASTNVGGSANVFGNSFLRSFAKIVGPLDISGQLTEQAGAQVGGPIHRPGAAAQSVLPTNPVTPGTQNVTVNNGATQTIPPGSYGDLILRARSNVTLSAGTYNLRSLTVEGQTSVKLDTVAGDVLVNVLGNVTIFSGAGFTTGDPSKVLLYSTGNITVEANTTFPGTLIAPFGQLDVSNFVSISGCVGGRDVIVDTNSKITGHGIVTGGRQACDEQLTVLATQLTQVQAQLTAQTTQCQQDLVAFSNCTKVPTASSLNLFDYKAGRQGGPLGPGPVDTNGEGCGVAGVGRKLEGGAFALWLLSAMVVWVRRRTSGARRA